MRKIVPLLMIASLTGCSMAQSSLIDGPARLGCSSDAGAYSLPKTLIAIEIKKNESSDLGEEYILGDVRLERRPDKGKTYCLDYLGSPTANEAFAVEKTAGGLLTKVSANSDDQSATIAKKIAETVFTLVSANPNFDPNAAVGSGRSAFNGYEPLLTTAYRAEFDPFNAGQAAVVNDSLRKFGFCILIEDQGLAPGQHDADSYCERPLGGVSLEQALAEGSAAEEERPAISDVRGILYRPRVPYVMYLFIKRDLNARGGWMLKASEAVHLENRSPVLGIGIDRAFFTDRKTTLTFDEGALLDIDIDKKSELAGFVEVPFYIAQGIAALPTNIIQVRINETNNNILLINAQQQLIESEKQYRATLAELTKLQAGETPGNQTSQTPASDVRPEVPAAAAAGSANASRGSSAELSQCLARNAPSLGETEAARFCQCVASCNESREACEIACSG